MTKHEALLLLGGSVTSAAMKIGCTVQAVSNWPGVLSRRLQDRVQAVLWREYQHNLYKHPPKAVKEAEDASALV